MNRYWWSLIVCVVASPMFVWEFVRGIAEGNYHLFLFFTILTNALTCAYFIAKGLYIIIRYGKTDLNFRKSSHAEVGTLLSATNTFDRFLDAVSIITTICMFIVCFVFWTLLSGVMTWGWNLDSVYCVFDHLVVPILKIIDFVYFTPLETSSKVIYISCISYPFLYYVFTTIYGLLSTDHFYPYWFMDPEQLSYGMIIVFFIILLLLFLVVIYGFVRLISVVKRKRSSAVMSLTTECSVCSRQ